MRGWQFVGVVNKIEEAAFFLAKVEENVDDAHHYASAFLSAGRSVWWCMERTADPKAACARVPKKKRMHPAPLRPTETPPSPTLTKWFRTKWSTATQQSWWLDILDLRNDDIHEGVGPIGGYDSQVWVSGLTIHVERKVFLRDTQRGSGEPDAPVRLRNFFVETLRVVRECHTEFRSEVDPEGTLAAALATLVTKYLGGFTESQRSPTDI